MPCKTSPQAPLERPSRSSALGSGTHALGARLLACTVALMAAGVLRPAGAVPITLDFNLDGTSGAESTLSLEVVSSSPTNRIRNKVINRAVGQAFTFNWYSAGPGGFLSSIPQGTCSGVGTQWDWDTSQTIFSFTGGTCPADVCFSRTSPPPVVSKGPYSAPGRSLSGAGVTLSSASLSCSLLTFFSPPKTLSGVTSSVEQLTSGYFRYRTRVVNLTQTPIIFDLAAAPPCHCTIPGCQACLAEGVSVPPGGAKEYCEISEFPATEANNGFTLCGSSIPDGSSDPPVVQCSTGAAATKGMLNILVPDSTRMIGTLPFLTPLRVVVTDTPGGNGNGILDPGETASLSAYLLNAGPVPLNAVTAIFTSPPIDLTLDGTANPATVSITTANSPYPSIVGTLPTSPPPGDCSTAAAPLNPSSNSTPFVVSVPLNHPGGVGRPFNLSVSGIVGGGPPVPFQMDVPFVLVIGSICNPP